MLIIILFLIYIVYVYIISAIIMWNKIMCKYIDKYYNSYIKDDKIINIAF